MEITTKAREYLLDLQKSLSEANTKLVQIKLDASASGVEQLTQGVSTALAGINQVLRNSN